jgi:hypothetical protein
MGANDVVQAWDTQVGAGVRKYFAVKPVSGNANLGLALFVSDPSNPATLYRPRSQAAVVADASGAGGSEFMNYLPSAGDWAGIAVWNNGATGSTQYFLYTDVSAPTGSVSINGGNAYVNSLAVTLTTPATDADTGVAEMRFSNDGSAWSAWEPKAATKSWTLTAGDGTKTVYAQYRNNAGMVSSTVSDTITVDTVAPSSQATSPATSPTLSFPVSWTGADAASGIANYDVQYRVGGGGWLTWLSNTTATSMSFGPGLPGGGTVHRGETYRFRSRARDNAGNVEAWPPGDGDSATRVLWAVYLPITMR